MARSSAKRTARYSAWLLVVMPRNLPPVSRTCSPVAFCMTNPLALGPGLPLEPPSALIITFLGNVCSDIFTKLNCSIVWRGANEILDKFL